MALAGSAVRVLIELNLGFNGYNNGGVGLGYTQVETRLRYGSEKVKRAFDQLQEYGFIFYHAQSSFNVKTKKRGSGRSPFMQCRTDLPRMRGKK
jgi:hypothetical protein